MVKQFYLTLAGTTILSQSGAGSNGNEGILPILKSLMIGISPLDSLVSYSGHLLLGWEGSYTPAEIQLVYFDKEKILLNLRSQQIFIQEIYKHNF